jgi:uncharacterized protein (DUF58 family)
MKKIISSSIKKAIYSIKEFHQNYFPEEHIQKLPLEKISKKETIRQIKKLDIKTKKLVDGLISGNYHSIFRGNGIEFSEIREYKTGDDIRSIDWNVTARYNAPFVKEFIEERDLNIYFILDMSSSNNFGNTTSKTKKSIELISSLMFSAIQNNDNVGLILFTEEVEKFIPARKGKKHTLKLLDIILNFSPKQKTTSIKNALDFTSKVIKRKSILFLVSDFNSPDFSKPLKILKQRQDIIAIKISDNIEKELPDIGLIQLEDEETGEQILIDTSNQELQENYKKIIKENDKKLNNLFKKYKIDKIEITTDEAYEKPLKKFFQIRKNRMIK